MARYRTYASGIYGYKYKDLFVEKDKEKKTYRAVGLFSKKRRVLTQDYPTPEEAEWFIDLRSASVAEKELVRNLYKYDVPQLSSLLVESMQKENAEISFWLEKIRDRKAKGLPLDPENYHN